jgi:hypothetical protein
MASTISLGDNCILGLKKYVVMLIDQQRAKWVVSILSGPAGNINRGSHQPHYMVIH